MVLSEWDKGSVIPHKAFDCLARPREEGGSSRTHPLEPLRQTLPRAGGDPPPWSLIPANWSAEAPWETLKSLTIGRGQNCRGRERVFIKLAPEPSGTWEGGSFPTPQGNRRGETPTRSELGHQSRATEGHPSPLLNLEHSAKPVPLLTPHLCPGLDHGFLLRASRMDGSPDPNPLCLHAHPHQHAQPGPRRLSHLRQQCGGKGSEVRDGSFHMLLLAADSDQLGMLDKYLQPPTIYSESLIFIWTTTKPNPAVKGGQPTPAAEPRWKLEPESPCSESLSPSLWLSSTHLFQY